VEVFHVQDQSAGTARQQQVAQVAGNVGVGVARLGVGAALPQHGDERGDADGRTASQ
jgi:hypothetical protein